MAHLIRCTPALILTAVLSLAAGAAEPRPIELLRAFAEGHRAAPAFRAAEGFLAEGVKAIFFDGPAFQGRPTRVFAWYAVPEGLPAGKKAPAMVLVHGGGGTAFADWVRLWKSRGYAAIAMDLCGCTPTGSYGKWQRHEAGGPAGWDASFQQMDWPVTDQWQYHAIANVVLAHSLIRSLPGVDPERVGLTGISWGGYLTCLAVGVDRRFRFGVPVYGCGFIDECVWKPTLDKMPEAQRRRWLDGWDPRHFLDGAEAPMLWVTGTDDFAYPLPAVQKSYRLPKGARTLAITLRMPHGHNGPGEKPAEIAGYADAFLNGRVPLAKLTGQGREGPTAWATFEAKAKLARAELLYTTASGPWPRREWKAVPATLDAAAGKVTATLPEGVTCYFLNVIDARGLTVSSEHEEMQGR